MLKPYSDSPASGEADPMQYTAKNGKQQWKPAMHWVQDNTEDSIGFCLACAHVQGATEPDARKYRCTCCGEMKVYGLEELMLMGLVHDED